MEAAVVTLRFATRADTLATLSASLSGTVVLPDDADYDDLAGIHNLVYAARPAAIVRVADADDVATTINFAREHDLEIAVRSGGHSLAGHSSGNGVLVIDVRDLRGLHIDPEQRIAWAGAGLTAGEYTDAAAEHGLATPFGDTASVGLGGITLGGGIGWLARKHGLTIDSLLAVEIVTADGEILTATETEHPDLFWALRGGGGNFGVVTRFCYRLHPVDHVLGGALFMPANRDVLRSLVPIASSAPEELTTIATLMRIPPMPFVPEQHHGQLSLMITFVYAGDPVAGQAAIQPFRDVATPLAEMVAPMPYPGIYEFTAEASQPMTATIRSLFMDALDDAAVDAFLEAAEVGPGMSMIEIRTLGGAVSRVAPEATSFAHRRPEVFVALINLLEPSEAGAAIGWNRDLFEKLAPKANGVYVNFLEDEGGARIRDAYPGGAYERLVEIKRRYDPFNVFRRNQNISPD